jgi:hypothetical protein
MDPVSAEQFLLDQVPLSQRALFAPALKTAYLAVEKLAKDEPALQVPSAQIGHIRAWAADLAVERLIKSGAFRADCRWQSFYRPTGKYLKVMLPEATLSVSQVVRAERCPRTAMFRHNAILNNEPFLPLEEFDDERRITGLPHVLLVHGHTDLNFIHLGVPRVHGWKGYIYQTPNLVRMPHEVPQEGPPTEDTEADPVMALKEELKRWRRDNGQE